MLQFNPAKDPHILLKYGFENMTYKVDGRQVESEHWKYRAPCDRQRSILIFAGRGWSEVVIFPQWNDYGAKIPNVLIRLIKDNILIESEEAPRIKKEDKQQ